MPHASWFVSALLSLTPLCAQEPGASRPETAVTWSHDLDATLAEAKAQAQPVLVFFTAAWCGPCQKLKQEVCSTKLFARTFAGHRFVLVDIDTDAGKAAKAAWEVQPIPDLRFVSARGVEIGGCVGEQPLTGLAQALAAARQSEAHEAQLRVALGAPPTPTALLELAEHLLRRPTKAPALAVLDQVLAQVEVPAAVAARAHWLAVGARLHPIGAPRPAALSDAERRLAQCEPLVAAGAPAAYRDAIRAWVQWLAVLTAWAQERARAGQRETPLAVAADAPLRGTLAALAATAADAPAVDAAADGLLIDGLLHYYTGDHAGGAERLARFTRAFPQHRWHGEGVRFLAICQRLMAQAAAASRPASRPQ